MKAMNITNYKLYNDKNNEEFRICSMSDLHYNEKLKMILSNIEKLRPNYMMIPGDLIDSTDSIIELKNKRRLLLWLKEMSEISKIFISLGSHDYYKLSIDGNKSKDNWNLEFVSNFIEEINDEKNINVLNNDSYKDNNIFVTGYTQSIEYYNPLLNKKSGIFTHNCENKQVMLEELKKLKDKIQNIPNDTVNFMMIHSPIYLKDKEIIENINEYDYYISGHMHNGLVPPVINELWKSSRGIIGPTRDLFPKNARNTLRYKNDKLIVNGALSTFHENHGMFSKLNFIYPSYMCVIDFTKNLEYDKDKIYTKRYYNK